MSSATMTDMDLTRGMFREPEPEEERAPDAGLSPRQVRLARLWQYFRCDNYSSRGVNWNGNPATDHIEREAIASQAFIPPGFVDGGTTMPLELRRPDAPFYLGKVIPLRFTSLLFGARRHPRISVSDDAATDDWLNAVIDQGRLWAHMISVRNHGGGMGTVGLGFKFVNGRVQFELHDARLCTPTFVDPDTQEVDQLDKRYVFEEDVRDAKGNWVKGRFWYRRLITHDKDITWPKVPVRDAEPNWEGARRVEVDHGFGFCPVVWIQNQPVEGEIDGDPDCHGAYDLIEKCDALRSQGAKGAIANCDPTLHINSDADINQVMTGSGGALKTEMGGGAKYLEVTGAAAKSAYDTADTLEEKILTMTRCYLDTNTGGPSRTASEVEHNYSSMIEQADILREQYGEKGVKRLLDLLLRAARIAGTARTVMGPDGLPRIVRQVLQLPPRVLTDEDGVVVGTAARQLGNGQQLEIKWPPYFQPTLDDINKAVLSAGQAVQFGVMDMTHAVGLLSPYFQVEDQKKLVRELVHAAANTSSQLQDSLAARMANPHALGNPQAAPPGLPPKPELP